MLCNVYAIGVMLWISQNTWLLWSSFSIIRGMALDFCGKNGQLKHSHPHGLERNQHRAASTNFNSSLDRHVPQWDRILGQNQLSKLEPFIGLKLLQPVFLMYFRCPILGRSLTGQPWTLENIAVGFLLSIISWSHSKDCFITRMPQSPGWLLERDLMTKVSLIYRIYVRVYCSWNEWVIIWFLFVLQHLKVLIMSRLFAILTSCQSTEVTGCRCHRKLAMGPALTCLVSQILKPPSSAPGKVQQSEKTDKKW